VVVAVLVVAVLLTAEAAEDATAAPKPRRFLLGGVVRLAAYRGWPLSLLLLSVPRTQLTVQTIPTVQS
jgi:hypothetical protein